MIIANIVNIVEPLNSKIFNWRLVMYTLHFAKTHYACSEGDVVNEG